MSLEFTFKNIVGVNQQLYCQACCCWMRVLFYRCEILLSWAWQLVLN